MDWDKLIASLESTAALMSKGMEAEVEAGRESPAIIYGTVAGVCNALIDAIRNGLQTTKH